MYAKNNGHATYVVITNKEKKESISIGTFGYMKHKGDWKDIIPDWKNYKEFTFYTVYDKDLKKVE